MEIRSSFQLKFEDLKSINFDIFIVASGYEKRSRYFTSQYLKIGNPSQRLCFGFYNNKEKFERKNNDSFFLKNKFNIYDIEADFFYEFKNKLQLYLVDFKNDKLNILIDYSSMTRIWYGGLIKYLQHLKHPYIKNIIVVFAYTHSNKIANSNEKFPNTITESILDYSNVENPNKKMALIIGLGVEIYRAAGLFEFLYADSSNTYIFYNDVVVKELNKSLVHKVNELLLGHIPEEHFIRYDLNDFKSTYAVLNSLCMYLKASDHRVILAPLGPKPFGLISFIIAAKNNYQVYRVSGGGIHNVIPEKGTDFLLLQLNFTDNGYDD